MTKVKSIIYVLSLIFFSVTLPVVVFEFSVCYSSMGSNTIFSSILSFSQTLCPYPSSEQVIITVGGSWLLWVQMLQPNGVFPLELYKSSYTVC